MVFSVIIGSVGVALLLVAFFLNLFNLLKQNTLLYTGLNIFGAVLSCYASYLISYYSFVILEGTWAIVALVGFVSVLKKRKK